MVLLAFSLRATAWAGTVARSAMRRVVGEVHFTAVVRVFVAVKKAGKADDEAAFALDAVGEGAGNRAFAVARAAVVLLGGDMNFASVILALVAIRIPGQANGDATGGFSSAAGFCSRDFTRSARSSATTRLGVRRVDAVSRTFQVFQG